MTDTKSDVKKSRGQQEPLTFENSCIYHGMDFEALFDYMGYPGHEQYFYQIVEAFDGLSDENLDERAQVLASEAQKLHPEYSKKQNEAPIQFPLFDFWQFYILLVKCVPYRHIGHRLVVEIAKKLEKIGESENPQWNDLPDLGMVTREAWLNPTDEDIIGGDEKFTRDQWLNFQTWLACLIGSGSKRGLNFVLWSLMESLEEDLEKLEGNLKRVREERKDLIESTRRQKLEWRLENEQVWRQEHGLGEKSQDEVVNNAKDELGEESVDKINAAGAVSDASIQEQAESSDSPARGLCVEAVMRVAVAAEWFIHASPVILKHCLLWSTRGPFDEADQRIYRPGPLFGGTFGMSLERWGFWKRRLGELKLLTGDEEVRQSVDAALEKMTAAELAASESL